MLNRANTSFDSDAFTAHLFAPIPEEFAYLCEATISYIKRLSKLVAASAEKLGITDHALIRKMICCLFLYPEQEQMSFVAGNAAVIERQQALIRVQLTYMMNMLNQRDVGPIINILASVKNQQTFNDMSLLIKKVADEEMDQTYLPDWLAILNFLHDPNIVEPYFEELESELQNYVKRLEDKSEFMLMDDGRYLLGIDKDNRYKRYKVLSGYLYEWAKNNGFKNHAKVISALDEKVFFSLLSSHTFFKDNASNVGNDHGIWSHAIQWYLIFKHHQKTNFLQHNPLAVYASMHTTRNEENATNSITVWMLVVDKYNINNFCSPEYVTQTISHFLKRDKWPLLAQSIIRSQDKLNWKFGSTDGYSKHQLNKHAGEQVDGVVMRTFTI